MKALQNQLKKELKRGSRVSWRRFLKDIMIKDGIMYNRGLWRMLRWSRQAPGARTAHIPALRQNGQEEATQDNEKRA